MTKNEKTFTILSGFRAALDVMDALRVRVNFNTNGDLIISVPKRLAAQFRAYMRANGGANALLYRIY